MLRRIVVFWLLAASWAAAQSLPVVIDTDAGSDDLMAIAFLLSRKNVTIEAITTCNGLAHVEAGARNVASLVEAGGASAIPVFPGRPTPLQGRAEFPAEWRRVSDELPGVHLPPLSGALPQGTAVEYLTRRMRDQQRPFRILALGPLTNLAEAFRREPGGVHTIREIVIMGGAVNVPGNLGDGGFLKTSNTSAEWNIYVDPLAAAEVFASGVKITLVPLDATNKVPIDAAFLAAIQKQATTPLGRIVGQILETDRKYIESGFYYAWDPLAAVILFDPRVGKMRPASIEIRRKPPEEGRTAAIPGRPPNTQVVYEADASAFRKLFLSSFSGGGGSSR